MKLTGIRVIRGPDWCHGNDDGGIGYLGTVVKVFANNNAVLVTWDVGTETVCRAGIDGAFDLRVFDNAQTGVVHDGFTCDICGDDNLTGMRWKCLVCKDYDECTRCYMGTGNPVTHAHNTNHAFVRFTTKKSTVVEVAPRRMSKRQPIYGIFPGAMVIKVVLDSNGDEPLFWNTGIVQELTRQQDSYRGAVKVKWNDGIIKSTDEGTELPVYRVGCGGTVELKLIKPASPGDVYIEHLPVLDLTVPVEVNYKRGDAVRVELKLETFKALQREYGGWVDTLEGILGLDGIIQDIFKGRGPTLMYVLYRQQERLFRSGYANSLTKIYRVNPRDKVHVRSMQIGHAGWHPTHITTLGKTGHVIRIEDSGYALVDIQGETFVINQDCLTVIGCYDNLRNKAEYDPVPLSARRRKPPNGVSIDIGTRVVRGPDWSSDFANQDGGEGHLGSLSEICGQLDEDMYPRDCVVVQWDNGERNVYRAGYENFYDLRMFDNAGIGIKHKKSCSACKINTVLGLLWTCQQCPTVSLCTDCYGANTHDVNHAFTRFDHPEDQGECSEARSESSKRGEWSGIFEKSKVQRGPDWRWQNQDGGAGKEGEVISIVYFSPDTDHDAAEVTWQNGYTNVYRLGYRGRLDLKCVKPAKGGCYYRNHLPTLKLATSTESKPEVTEEAKVVVKPAEIKLVPTGTHSPVVTSNGSSSATTVTCSSTSIPSRFKTGDRVIIEIDVDVLKMIEQTRMAWNQQMTECVGKVGYVIVCKGLDVTVDFGEAGRWTFSESVLTKVKEIRKGGPVTLKQFIDTRLQTKQGSCNDGMMKMLMDIEAEGRAIRQAVRCDNIEVATSLLKIAVKCGHRDMVKYLVESGCNNDAVHIAVGNKNVPLLTQLRDCGFDVNKPNALQHSPLFDAIILNDPDVLTTILNWPNLDVTTADSSGFTPFASACRSGNEQVVEGVLLIAPDELNRQKEDGFTGLHVAVSNKRTEIVRFLMSKHGICVNLATKEGRTPLHIASEGGQVDIARLFIDRGAQVWRLDKRTKTCLHLCAESSMAPENQKSAILDMAKLLLEKGVWADFKDTSGKRAVDYLIPAYRDEFTNLVKNYAVSRPRGSCVTDPPQSLPANFESDGKQDIPEGPGSLNIVSTGKGHIPTIIQGQMHGDDDPLLCNACDEEPIRFGLKPCRHLVCSECKPAEKAKRKLCTFCKEPVTEVVEFDQR